MLLWKFTPCPSWTPSDALQTTVSAKLVLDIDWFTILEFSFEVSWSATLTLKMSFTIEGEIAFKGILPIWNKKQLGQLLLPLGPVTIPVAFLMGLDAGAEASLKGAIGVEATGFSITGGVKSGFKYLSGQSPYKYVKPTLTTQIFPPKLFATATATLKVSFEPYAILSFAYVFDIKVKVEQWVELSAAFPHSACNKLSARLEAAEGTNVHILVEELSLTLSLWGVTKKLVMPLPYLPARFKIQARPKRQLASIGGVALPRCVGNSAVKPVKKSRRRALQEAAAALPPLDVAVSLRLPFALLNADSAVDSALAAFRVSGDQLAAEAALVDVAGIVTSIGRLGTSSQAHATAAGAMLPLPFVLDDSDGTSQNSSSFDGLDVPPSALLPCGLPGGCFLVVEPWDACDAVCGPALRRRRVMCIAADSGSQMPLAVCAAGSANASLAATGVFSSDLLRRLPPSVERCEAIPECTAQAFPADGQASASPSVQLVPVQSSGMLATQALHRVFLQGSSTTASGDSDAAACTAVFAVERSAAVGVSTAVCVHALTSDAATEPRFFATTDRAAALAAAAGSAAADDVALGMGMGMGLSELWRPVDAVAAFPLAANTAHLGSLMAASLSSVGLRAVSKCLELPAAVLTEVQNGAASASPVYVGASLGPSGSCTAPALLTASSAPMHRIRVGESATVSIALQPADGSESHWQAQAHAWAQARVLLSPPTATPTTASPVGAIVVVTSANSENPPTLHVVQAAPAAGGASSAAGSEERFDPAYHSGITLLSNWPFDPVLSTVAPLSSVGTDVAWQPLGSAVLVPASVAVLSFPTLPAQAGKIPDAAESLLSVTMPSPASFATQEPAAPTSVRVLAAPVYDAQGAASQLNNAAPQAVSYMFPARTDAALGPRLSLHVLRSPHGATTTHATFRVRVQLAPGAPASCASALPLLVGVAPGEASLDAQVVFAHPSASAALAVHDARVQPLSIDSNGNGNVGIDGEGSWLYGVVSAREAWFTDTLTLLVSDLPHESADADCGRWLTGYALEASILEALPPQLRRTVPVVVGSGAAHFSLSSSVPSASSSSSSAPCDSTISSVPSAPLSASASLEGEAGGMAAAQSLLYPLVDSLPADMLLLSVTAPTSQGGRALTTSAALQSPTGLHSAQGSDAIPIGSISAAVRPGARCRPMGATKSLTALLPGQADVRCDREAAAPVLLLQTAYATAESSNGDSGLTDSIMLGSMGAADLPLCPVSAAEADVFAQPAPAGNGASSSSSQTKRPQRPGGGADGDAQWADALPWWLSPDDPISWTALASNSASSSGPSTAASLRARMLQSEATSETSSASPYLAVWDAVSQVWIPVASAPLAAASAEVGSVSECASAVIAAAALQSAAAADAAPSDVLRQAAASLLGADAATKLACAVLSLPSSNSAPLAIALRVSGWSVASLALLPLAGTSLQFTAAGFTMPDSVSEARGFDSPSGAQAGVASVRSVNCGSDSRRMYARAALTPAPASAAGITSSSSSSNSNQAVSTSELPHPLRVAVIFTTAAGLDSGFSLATLASEGRREAAAALSLSADAFGALVNSSGSAGASPTGCMRAAFRWAAAPWEPCDSQCGPGVQKRSVWCVDSVTGGPVDAAVCERAGLPQPLEQRGCDAGTCSFSAGEWGACSPVCGAEGERQREWACRNGIGAPVEPWRCSNSTLPYGPSFDADDRLETAPCPRELVRPCALVSGSADSAGSRPVFVWRHGPWAACASTRWLRSPGASLPQGDSASAADPMGHMGLRSRPVDCVAIGSDTPLLSAAQFAALPAQPERLCRLYSSSPQPADVKACRAHPPASAAIAVRHVPLLNMREGITGTAARRRRFSLLPEQAASLLVPVRDIITAARTGASQSTSGGVCVRVAASVVPSGVKACSDVTAMTAVRSCGVELRLCLSHPQALVDGNSKFVRQSDAAGNITSVWFRGLPFDDPGAALPNTPGAVPATASVIGRCFAAAHKCLAQQVCDAGVTSAAAAAVSAQCAAAISAANCPASVPRAEWRSPSGAPFSLPPSSSLNAPSVGVFASPVALEPSSAAVGAPLQFAPGSTFAFPASEAAATWYTWAVPSLALHQPTGSKSPRRPAFAYMPILSISEPTSQVGSMPSSLSLVSAAALPPAFDSQLYSHAMLQVSNVEGAVAGLTTLVDVEATPLTVAPAAARAVLGGSLVAMVQRLGHVPDTALAAGGLTLTIAVECDEWLLPAAASDVATGYWASLLRMLHADPVAEDGTLLPQLSAPGSWSKLAAPLLQRGSVPFTVSFDIPAAPGAAAVVSAASASSTAGSHTDSLLASNVDGAARDGSVSQLQQGRAKPLRYGTAAVTRITIELPPLRGYLPSSDELLRLTVPGEFLASGVDAVAVALAGAGGSMQQLRIRATRKSCILSPWSQWSKCAAVTDTSLSGGASNAAGSRAGVSSRSRAVLQGPGASAPACPPLRESRPCVLLPPSSGATAGQKGSGSGSGASNLPSLAGSSAASAVSAALQVGDGLRLQPGAGASSQDASLLAGSSAAVLARDTFAALRVRRLAALGSIRRDMLACLGMSTPCAQGICLAGQCVCPAGFTGADCSAPPPLQLANAPLLNSSRDTACVSMTTATSNDASGRHTLSLLASTQVSTRPVTCSPAQRGSAGPLCMAGAPSVRANSAVDASEGSPASPGVFSCPFHPPVSAASSADADADAVSLTTLLRLPVTAIVLASPSLRTARIPDVTDAPSAGSALPDAPVVPLASIAQHAAQPLAIDAALMQQLSLWLQDVVQALLMLDTDSGNATGGTSAVQLQLTSAVDVGSLSVRLPAQADAAVSALNTAIEAFSPGSAVPLTLHAVVDVQLTLSALAGTRRDAMQAALHASTGQFMRSLACRSSGAPSVARSNGDPEGRSSGAAAAAVLRRGAVGAAAFAGGAADDAASTVEAALLCTPADADVAFIDLSYATAAGRFTQSRDLAPLFAASLSSEAVTSGPASVVSTRLDPTDGAATLVASSEARTGGLSTADKLLRTPVGISALTALAAGVAMLLVFFAAIDACVPLAKLRCFRSASGSAVAVANPLRALPMSGLKLQASGTAARARPAADDPSMLALDPRARSRRLQPATVALGASAVLLLLVFASLLGSALAVNPAHAASTGHHSSGRASRMAASARTHKKAPGDGFAVPPASFHEAHAAASLTGMARVTDPQAADAGGFHADQTAARTLRHLHIDNEAVGPTGIFAGSGAGGVHGRRAAAVASIEAAAAAATSTSSAPRVDAIAAHMDRLNEQRTAQHAAHLNEVFAMQRAGVAEADAALAGIVPGRDSADPAGFSWASDEVGIAGGRRLFYTTAQAHDGSPEHTLRTLPPLTYVPPQRLPDSLAYDVTVGDHVIHLDAGIGGESHPLVLSLTCPRSAALELRLQEAALPAEQLYSESSEHRRARRMAAMDRAGTMRVRVLHGPADESDGEGAALMTQLLSAVDGAPFILPSEWRVGDVLVGDHRWSCRFDADDGGVSPFYREITSIEQEAMTVELLQSTGSASSGSDVRVRVQVLRIGFEDVHPLSLFDEYNVRGHADPQPFSWAPAHGNGVHPVPGPVVAPLSPQERAQHAQGGRLDRRLWGGSVNFDKTYRWQPSNPTLFANSWLNVSCDACYAQLKAGMGFSLQGKWLKLKEVRSDS